MKIKHNASIVGCRSEILIAAISIIESLYIEYGVECVITSGTEKYKHSAKRSAHYRGDALDFRTRDFKTTDEKLKFYEDLTMELGSDFVCVLEKTHLHVHWSPAYD
jgi:hypothetical protein